MAIKLRDRYGNRANEPSVDYPTGSVKNKSAPDATDGTPLEKDWANDLLGSRDAIMKAAGVTADGNVETAEKSQVLESLNKLYVSNSRTVSSGVGLSGGGSLSSNLTFSVKYGTASGTAAVGNDSRINNGQTAFGWGNHASAGYVPSARTITAGTGLTGGGNLTANRTLSVNYGTAAGTACQGNDARLSDSREWTASTVSQSEAESGTATTRRAWTSQRVRQAFSAAFNSVTSAFTRTLLTQTSAAQVRSSLQLGSVATRDASGATAMPGDALVVPNSANLRIGIPRDSAGSVSLNFGSTDSLPEAVRLIDTLGRDFRIVRSNKAGDEYVQYFLFPEEDKYPGRQTVVTTSTVLGSTGTSSDLPMSQKAVTDSLIGNSQSWMDVTSSRVSGTTYTNTTGRTIVIMMLTSSNNSDFEIDGMTVNFWSEVGAFTGIIPAGSRYRLASGNPGGWYELRT